MFVLHKQLALCTVLRSKLFAQFNPVLLKATVVQRSFMKRRPFENVTQSHKRVKIMVNEERKNTVIPSFNTHNQWRFDSIHNPRWTSKDDLEKLKHVDNRLTFHKSLPKQQHYSIDITDEEKLIFDFLLEVNSFYKLNTTLRVAGGWVRNKLLGILCDDIDVALDNMLGKEFAEYVTKHAELKGMKQHTVGVIEARPEQSKHLETATTHIYGQAIDFVNLRCEEYATDSRIPTSMRLGTPLEDSLRRDLTINSLYYNLNNRTVEDFTGRGVQDLQLGLVQTPLPARSTFLDDPLRVLRAVRFAVTFNFLVTDELIESAQLREVHDALAEKVSRERIGTELGKMMKGSDPVGAMSLLNEFNVVDIVFTNCNGFELGKPYKKKTHAKHATTVYEKPESLRWTPEQWKNAMFRMRVMYRDAQDVQLKGKDRTVLMFAALLSSNLDISKYTYPQIYDYCENVMITSLRLSNHLVSDVAMTIYGAYQVHHLLRGASNLINVDINDLVDDYKNLIEGKYRLVIGKWLRENVKRLYKMPILLANVIDTSGNELDTLEADRAYGATSIRGRAFIKALMHADRGHMIDDVVDMKTIMNGNEIASYLGIKPGKILTVIIDEMFDWQISRVENERTRNGVEQWLDANKERFLKLNESFLKERKK
jgi:tRNA nucleotidyltransferase/poly(A) polymerase